MKLRIFCLAQRSLVFAAAIFICISSAPVLSAADTFTWQNPPLSITANLSSTAGDPLLTWPGHSFVGGDIVIFTSGAPGGFSLNTNYFVVNPDTAAGTFSLSATTSENPIVPSSSVTSGAATAGYKIWDKPENWVYQDDQDPQNPSNGELIVPNLTDGIVIISSDYSSQERIGRPGQSVFGKINFTDTLAPAFGLGLTGGTFFFDNIETAAEINVSQPGNGGTPLVLSGSGLGYSPLSIVTLQGGITINVTGNATPSVFGNGIIWDIQGPLSLVSGNYQTEGVNVFPQTWPLNVAAGVNVQALFDNTRNQILGGLSGSGTVGTNDGSATVGTLTLSPVDGAVTTFAGNLGGDFSTIGQPNSNFNVVKAGPGTQVFSSANSYTGTTTISAGILKMGHPGALGTNTGGTDVNGGTLDLNGYSVSATAGPMATNEPLALVGTGANGVGALINSSTSPVVFDREFNNGGRTFSVGGVGDITFGRVTGAGGLRLTKVGTNTVTIANPLDNQFLTTVVNSGTLVLAAQPAGAKVTDGLTIETNGTARLGSVGGTSENISNGAVVQVEGIFNLNGFNEIIGGLSSTTTTGLVKNDGAAPVTLTLGINTGVFLGSITNGVSAISLVKTGGGIQTLGGVNTYTGTTAVNGGTLLVNGSLANSSAVTVAVGATLGGSGTIQNATTVNGNLSPGNASGTGTLTFSSSLAINTSSPTSSTLNLRITDWTNTTAGTGYGTTVAPSIAITATAANKLVISVDATGSTGFTETTRTYKIASAANGITGFDPATTQVTFTGLTSPTGTFTAALSGDGKDLLVTYTAGSGLIPGVWDSEDATGNWSAGLNWAPDVPPVAGNFLQFNTAADEVVNNDLTAGIVFAGIRFGETAGTFTVQGNSLGLSGTGIPSTAIANLSTRTQTINTPIVFGNSTLNIALTGGGLSLGGALSVAGPSTNINVTGGFPLAINASGTIAGTGGSLAMANTAGQVLQIGSGVTLTGALRGGGALGGGLTFANSTGTVIHTGSSQTFSGPIIGAGTIIARSAFSVNGNNTAWTGVLQIEAGDNRINGGWGNALIRLNGTALNNSGIYTNSNNPNIPNNINVIGNGGFIRFNNGTAILGGAVTGGGQFDLRLSGDNNAFNLSGNWSAFTGKLQMTLSAAANPVNVGFININSATTSTPTAAYDLASRGVILQTGNAITAASLGSLTGVTGSILRGNVVGTSTFTIGALGTNTIFAGLITPGSAAGQFTAITKVGAGTLTLSGANTYTGPTTVNGGILSVTGSLTSPVTVDSGGTLGGTGTVNATVTAGGRIAPGAGVGTLTTGTAAFISGGSLAVEVDGTTSDKLVVNGDLTITGATLTTTDLAAVATGQTRTIASYTGTLTGTFGAIPSGYTVAYNVGTGGKEIQITKVAGSGFDTWKTLPGNGLTAGVNDGINDDPDQDGIQNLLEFILGGVPAGSGSSNTSILPTQQIVGSNLVFTYFRGQDSISDTTQVVEWNTNLSSTWTSIPVTAASGGSVTVTSNTPTSGIDRVQVSIPRGTNTKLFARLKATRP